MTINQTTLIKITREIMDEPLREFGFMYDDKVFELEKGLYGYEKKAQKKNLNLYIEFQTFGISLEEIYAVRVNLTRTTASDLHVYVKKDPVNGVKQFYIPMHPALFFKGYKGEGWAWNVSLEDKARIEIQDALQKIIQFAIPFLEDPNSTIELLFGERDSI